MLVMEIVDFNYILITYDNTILHNFWEDSNPYVFMSQLLIIRGSKHQSYTKNSITLIQYGYHKASPPPT